MLVSIDLSSSEDDDEVAVVAGAAPAAAAAASSSTAAPAAAPAKRQRLEPPRSRGVRRVTPPPQGSTSQPRGPTPPPSEAVINAAFAACQRAADSSRSGGGGGSRSGGGGSSSGGHSGGSSRRTDLRQDLIDAVLASAGQGGQASGSGGGSSGSDDAPPVSFASADAYRRFFRPLLLLELEEELTRGAEETHRHDAPVAATPAELRQLHALGGATACWQLITRAAGDVRTKLRDLDIVRVAVADGFSPPSGSDGRWLAQLPKLLPLTAVVRRADHEGRQITLHLALPQSAVAGSQQKAAAGDGSAAAGRGGAGGGGAAQLRLTRMGSCTSAWREWEALHQLHAKLEPPLLRCLLSATAADGADGAAFGSDSRWAKRERHMQRLYRESSLDEDQRAALARVARCAHDRSPGFELVQGPPGTGKTTLLLALLNVLHNAATQNHYEALLDTFARAAKAAAPGGGAASVSGGGDMLQRISAGLERDATMRAITAPRRGRVLVCTHSNAAVDELISRLLARRPPFFDEFGKAYMPDVVRIGTHGASNDCTLDARVEELRTRLGTEGGKELPLPRLKQRRRELLEHQQSLEAARSQLATKREQWAKRRAQLRDQYANARLDVSVGLERLDANAEELRKQEHEAHAKLDDLAGRILQAHDQAAAAAADAHVLSCLKRPAPNTPEGERRRMAREETDALEAAVLSRAHIVFTTMSSAAGQRLAALEGGFETAVFDEAAQAGELPTLIPLQYNVHLAVLVGDPQQLPATILSQRAKRGGLGRSLFERLQQAGHPTLVLRTQYRMHPAIRRFPSAHFYGNVLRDGGTVARACRAPPGAVDGSPACVAEARPELRLAPYCFFNLRGAQRRDDGRSYSNEAEAWLCCRLVGALRKSQERYLRRVAAETAGKRAAYELGCSRGHENCAWGALCGRVAVLTPYNGQVRLLERVFVDEFGESARTAVTFSNVDVFQGREQDVVVYSAVRSAAGLGFVADARRLNVALTRARHALYVVGSEESLRASDDWRALLDDARRRGCWRDEDARGGGGGADGLLARIPRTTLDGQLAGPWNAFAPAPAAGLARCDGVGELLNTPEEGELVDQ